MRKEFPRLELLSRISDLAHKSRVGQRISHPSEIAIFAIQHVLESTGSLLESIVDFGFDPSLIRVVGKPYSTNESVAEAIRSTLGIDVIGITSPTKSGGFEEHFASEIRLHFEAFITGLNSKGVQKLLILDDGGHAIRHASTSSVAKTINLCGIEQTRSGVAAARSANFPVVVVAENRIKLNIESHFVAEVVLRRLQKELSNISLSQPSIGVVGMGAVGTRVAEQASELGFEVLTYDRTSHSSELDLPKARSLHEILEESDVILGATGSDITTEWMSLSSNKLRILGSCSSADLEFRSILQAAAIQEPDIHVNLQFDLRSGRYLILNGGYPLNFSGAPVSIENEKIQFTRALLLAGVYQAARLVDDKDALPGGIALDPVWESLIIGDDSLREVTSGSTAGVKEDYQALVASLQ